MARSVSLEEIIRKYVLLPASPSSRGFYPVLCKVCNDHGRKGLRGGFRFDTGGVVGYHCFNCSHAAKFDPDVIKTKRSKKISHKMRQVLDGFGIPIDEVKEMMFNLLKDAGEVGHTDSDVGVQPTKSIEPNEIPLPKHFYRLDEAGPEDKWAEIAIDYLEHNRGIDPKGYTYFLCRETGVETIDKWVGRIIIPIYKNGKLIYFQGRALYNDKKKYESPAQPKDCVLYGYERLFEHTDMPLYVVEGFFDAYLIDGVAILGKELTEEQAQWLERSKRRKVFIPDRQGGGSKTPALNFIDRGWSISTPDIGSCKDINDAVMKYGKLYVMKAIADSITADRFTAQTRLGVYCEVETGDQSEKKNHLARKTKGRKW
jgi:hypothetical protein